MKTAGNHGYPVSEILHVQDEKPSNTAGGGCIAGSQIRTLNTVVSNSIPGASLATDKITLPAGRYKITASAPGYFCDRHRIRFLNVTDTTVVLVGTSEFVAGSVSATTRSLITGVFTITATKDFNITHHTQTSIAGNGLGVQTVTDALVEVYTTVMIEKIG